jgi:hypothetical protein
MNHQKIYESIIQKAKSENRKRETRYRIKKYNLTFIYYENHHILPRCLGGNDDKENLVLLTAKEHYVCHKLLTHIYKGNTKIICAFHRMTNDKRKNCRISSRDYAYVKELTTGGGNAFFNKHHSEKTKEILKIKKTGKKLSKEHCKSISNGLMGNTYRRGCTLTQDHKNKIGKSLKGIKRSLESKEKYRQCKLGVKRKKKTCPHCNKEIADNNYSRYHGNNCKYKK